MPSIFVALKKSVIPTITSCLDSLTHVLYPSKCRHCSELLPPRSPFLCPQCSHLLELLNPEHHCPTCFNPFPENGSCVCDECLHYPSLYCYVGAAFDYEGPAASLVRKLKYSGQPYLAKGMAAFLAAQFIHLNWPLPDLILPVPQSFSKWMQRGYNQSELLAQELGKILHVQTVNGMKRKGGDFSQAQLSLDMRQTLRSHCFKVKSNCKINKKSCLIVDDVMTSGSTLRRCAEALIDADCGPLYALTFCRTFLEKQY